jgi:hypothetical protein
VSNDTGCPRPFILANDYCASGLVPPVCPTVEVPQRREARIGAGGLPLRYARDLRPLTAIPLLAEDTPSLHPGLNQECPPLGSIRCPTLKSVPVGYPFSLLYGALRGTPRCALRLRYRIHGTQHGRRAQREGPAESPQEGGRSEVKRSRAGSPHGEPRTEPRPPRRRSRSGSPVGAPLRASRWWGTPAVGRTGGTAAFGIGLDSNYGGEHLAGIAAE